jgi:hypothetical protein
MSIVNKGSREKWMKRMNESGGDAEKLMRKEWKGGMEERSGGAGAVEWGVGSGEWCGGVE